jgi:COMPASS component SPP1
VEREKREKERERERVAADGHRVISPLGRRSPPGSQIGRATAAKKSDEARRADEAAAAAAIADVRKLEGAQSQVKNVDDTTCPSTSPSRSESRKVSQERSPVIALARESPIAKVEEPATRKFTDDASRKMSLDVVMNDVTVDVPVVKKESPLVPSFDVPSRSKERPR